MCGPVTPATWIACLSCQIVHSTQLHDSKRMPCVCWDANKSQNATKLPSDCAAIVHVGCIASTQLSYLHVLVQVDNGLAHPATETKPSRSAFCESFYRIYLLANEAEALFWANELICLAKQRVEGFGSPVRG